MIRGGYQTQFLQVRNGLAMYFHPALQNNSAPAVTRARYILSQSVSTNTCPPPDQGLANASAANTSPATALTIVRQQTTIRWNFTG